MNAIKFIFIYCKERNVIMTTDDVRAKMLSNEKFTKILKAVDKESPIKCRVKYVLDQMDISNERYIHIVAHGVIIKNLCMYSFWQTTGFKSDFHECNLELATLVSYYFNSEELIGILQFIKILQENIVKEYELQNVISIYNDLF